MKNAVSPERRSPSPMVDSATLRHRLDKLGYNEHLPPDAAPLVRRLLADLVVTTDTCRKLKVEGERWKADKQSVQAQIAPLRHELARLTAENNHLHHDIIRLADERDARDKKTAQAARRFESQTADLRFVASQYAHRVEVEQKRVEEARAKAESAFEKMGLFEKQTAEAKVTAAKKTKAFNPSADAAARTQKLFQRLQKIDIETGLEPLQNPPVHFPPPDPVVADMVNLAEGRINNLSKANEILSSKNMDIEHELDLVRKQVASREQEIQRLGAQLEIARAQQFTTIPLSAGKREEGINGKIQEIRDLDVARQRIEQLELQLEYLQEHAENLEKDISTHQEEKQTLVAGLEKEKKLLMDKVDREKERSRSLLKNLDKLERVVEEHTVLKSRSLQGSPARRSTSASPSRSSKNHPSLPPKQNRSSTESGRRSKSSNAPALDQREQIVALQAEVARLGKENDYINSILATKENEIRDLYEKLRNHRESEDTAKIDNFTEKTQQTAQSLGALEKSIQQLESENRSLRTKLSDQEAQKWAMENDLRASQRRLDKTSQFEAELVSFRTRAQTLQRDLTTQRSETERLNRLLEQAQRDSLEAQEAKQRLAHELQEVQGDRDELILALQKFEEQLAEVQHSVERVTADRDNMAGLYSQLNAELNELRQASNSSPPRGEQPPPRPNAPPEPSAPAMSPDGAGMNGDSSRNEILKELTRSQKRVRELEDELGKLQQDFEATLRRRRDEDATVGDVAAHLGSENDRLRSDLRQKEREEEELLERVRTAERQLELLRKDLEEVRLRDESSRKRVAEIETDRDRDSFVVRDLRGKVADLESRLNRATTECERLRKQSDSQTKQLGEQRQLLVEMDTDRDKDRSELDRKCERVDELEGTVSELRNHAMNAEQETDSLREQLDLLNHHLNERDKELSNLRLKLEQTVLERDRLAEESQRNAEEARNVGADLGAVTRENQILNRELVEVGSDRERLRSELAESGRQIRLLDDLIQSKDLEREQLFASYRKLASDYERLDMGNKLAGEESNNMRMEMVLRDKRVQQLQTALDDATSMVSQYKIDLGAYEKQCNNLSRSLATAERNIRHLEADKQRLIRDITAARDLALGLDRSKEDLQKQLVSSTLEAERMQAMVNRVDTDKEALSAQMRAEKMRADRLEQLLATERTRKFQNERAAQDIHELRGGLEDQLEQVNHQQTLTLQSQKRELDASKLEVKQLQSKIATLESKISVIKENLIKSEERVATLNIQIIDQRNELAGKQMLIEDLTAAAIGTERARIDRSRSPTRRRSKSRSRQMPPDETISMLETSMAQGGKTELEKKIITELSNTKRQLKKYEAQIAKRFHTPEKGTSRSTTRSPSRNSSSKNATGGSDGDVEVSTLDSVSDQGSPDEDDSVVDDLLAKFRAEGRHLDSFSPKSHGGEDGFSNWTSPAGTRATTSTVATPSKSGSPLAAFRRASSPTYRPSSAPNPSSIVKPTPVRTGPLTRSITPGTSTSRREGRPSSSPGPRSASPMHSAKEPEPVVERHQRLEEGRRLLQTIVQVRDALHSPDRPHIR